MNKTQRIEEYKDTVHCCMDGGYLNNDDKFIRLPKANFDDMMLYDRRFYDTPQADNDARPTVTVVNNDTLSAAQVLVEQGYHVTILNMASSYLPGGGVMKGSGAQEEDIFRRTTLLTYLYQLHPIGKEFGIDVPKSNIFYPIDGKCDIIWTPNVQVFKDSEKNNFRLLDKPFSVDVITCAAVRKPKLTADNKLSDADAITMKAKIANILSCAAIEPYEQNALVLGAFGCGAYGNPPDQIAQMFHQAIDNCKALSKLKLIQFAIIDSNSVGEKHNPNGNFQPFHNEFSKSCAKEKEKNSI